MENILSLLIHLQPQYGNASENTNIFQVIIKSSYSLQQKIRSCLENLDFNTVSLESLRELLQLDHSVSILTIDKTSYLIKTLVNQQNRTRDFYITWFMYFLCDKHYQNDGNGQQNFQQLLKTWLDYIKNDRDMLPQIIARLDILTDHLQSVIVNVNDDYRMMEFQDNILNTVFHPSKFLYFCIINNLNIRYFRFNLHNSD